MNAPRGQCRERNTDNLPDRTGPVTAREEGRWQLAISFLDPNNHSIAFHFFPALLRHDWHIALIKLKVSSMI